MNTRVRFLRLALALMLAGSAAAQSTDPIPQGVTTLVLGASISTARARGSRVSVPPLEQVRLQAPEGWAYPIQWTKDDRPIPGATSRTLLIPLASSTDSGRYNIASASGLVVANGADLNVVEAGHTGNFSSRFDIPSGSASQSVGFVVTGAVSKWLFVRAVGPTLTKFGIAKPAAQPNFRIFDASGKELNFTRPAVVLFDWDDVFAKAGAFPLAGGERSFTDYILPPGAYTIEVFDNSKLGGTVLLEIYDFPTAALKQILQVTPIPPGE